MKPSKIKQRVIFFVVFLVILSAMLIFTKIIPSNVYMRLLRTTYVDNSNLKRVADWSYGIKALIDRPIFGYGPRLTLDILIDKYNFHGDVHNTYITFGVMYGIPVLYLFIHTTISFAYYLYKNNERFILATFLAMVFEWNILPCHVCVSTWITLIIVMIFVRNRNEQINN